MRRNQSATTLPELCAAVLRLRKATRLKQVQLAPSLGFSAQTLSNFEVGRRIPRSKFILMKFRELAAALNMPAEVMLFDEALGSRFLEAALALNFNTQPSYTLHEWRLMQAARIAVRCWPELAWAMEQSAGEALTVVDRILSAAVPSTVDAAFYRDLEQRISTVAEQRSFDSFGKGESVDARRLSERHRDCA
jgi:transcriptional regulator with XRE-family HTH domain